MKNKINSFKGSIYYKFYPDKAFYSEITEHELMALQNANMHAQMQQQMEMEEDQYGATNRFE